MLAVAIVSIGSRRGWSYSAARLYQATQAQDGHWYWRATDTVGPSRRGNKIVRRDADEMAAKHDCPILNIRHGSPAPAQEVATHA